MCVNVHATPITRCGLLPALGQQVKRTPSGHERTSGAYHSGHSKIVYVTVLGVSHPRASAMLHPGTLRATSSISDGQWLFFCLGYQLCEETLGVNSVINPNNLWVSTLWLTQGPTLWTPYTSSDLCQKTGWTEYVCREIGTLDMSAAAERPNTLRTCMYIEIKLAIVVRTYSCVDRPGSVMSCSWVAA